MHIYFQLENMRGQEHLRPRHRWEDNSEIVWCELNSFGRRPGPVIGSCEHTNISSGSIEGGEFL